MINEISTKNINMVNGDALTMLKKLENNSIDAVICDLPYGTTQNKWDSIIDLEKLWEEMNRVKKCKSSPIILTACQPFTSVLVSSNLKDFKYEWIWEKSKATNYLNAKHQPMRAHESILVFYEKPTTYNPQMVQGEAYDKGTAHRPTGSYGAQVETTVKNDTGMRYPRTVQYFKTAESEKRLKGVPIHPTQKPLKLMEYLIKTYTNAGDTVLDMTMGSGTTMVACVNTNRKGIGIELSEEYFNHAVKRIENAENSK